MKKIVIFGIGQYWKLRKVCLEQDNEIVAFLDNKKKGTTLDGYQVVSPEQISGFEYDVILLMSLKYEKEMRQQLKDLNINMNYVYNWNQFAQEILREKCQVFNINSQEKINIIIFSSDLDYSGAPMTALYAAEVLKKDKVSIAIATSACDERLLQEVKEYGIGIIISPALPNYICCQLDLMINNANIIIANTILMLPVVRLLRGKKPILWWIHEANEAYTLLSENNDLTKDQYNEIHIKAVSKIALENFNNFFNTNISETMAYGIPDVKIRKKQHNKIIFAIIGMISNRKAQDVFIDAISLLNDFERKQCEFWIIGEIGASSYSKDVIAKADKFLEIKLCGSLTRKEISSIYEQVDVVVCPSREDPLPIVMTEAMMWNKVCITSDRTGTAEYISDGINGFVCKTEDSKDLCKKMQILINNKKMLKRIGYKGHILYESNWTLECFEQRLKDALEEALEKFIVAH